MRVRRVMELYVSDHPSGFDIAAGTGGSEFDHVVKSVGLTENRYGLDGRNHVAPGNGSLNIDYIARDESNPYFTYDASQCIVCSRCVRACEEVQGTFALTISGRGFASRVSPGMPAIVPAMRRRATSYSDSIVSSCAAKLGAPPDQAEWRCALFRIAT